MEQGITTMARALNEPLARPEVIDMDPEVKRKVDELWPRLGLA